MAQNISDACRDGNTTTADPMWIVIHGGAGQQRRRWGPDMSRIAADLVAHGWVLWREGADVVLKHRCMVLS